MEERISYVEGIKFQYWNGSRLALIQVNFPSWINLIHWCKVEGTYLISYIHGLPSKILYCKEPLMTWNNVCKVLGSTWSGRKIMPIVVDIMSLKSLSFNVEKDR